MVFDHKLTRCISLKNILFALRPLSDICLHFQEFSYLEYALEVLYMYSILNYQALFVNECHERY